MITTVSLQEGSRGSSSRPPVESGEYTAKLWSGRMLSAQRRNLACVTSQPVNPGREWIILGNYLVT